MSLYKVSDNVDTVFASDVDQLVDALTGLNDIGTITLFAPISAPVAPTVAVNATAGNLTGAYKYAVAFVTGYWKGAVGTGTLQTQGNTGGGAQSASVSPSAQQVNLTAIPTGPAGTVARIIYRTKAGGSTFYQLTQINDNTTTAYSDNIADASLVTTMPTTNTTGTIINGVPLTRSSVAESLLSSTSPTNVTTYTPSVGGNFVIYVYFRVVTAATNVAIEIDYTDAGGAQVLQVLPSALEQVGSYAPPAPVYISAVAGQPITVKVTAGTANQVYASATIIDF